MAGIGHTWKLLADSADRAHQEKESVRRRGLCSQSMGRNRTIVSHIEFPFNDTIHE